MATCKDCVHYDVCEFHLDEKVLQVLRKPLFHTQIRDNRRE